MQMRETERDVENGRLRPLMFTYPLDVMWFVNHHEIAVLLVLFAAEACARVLLRAVHGVRRASWCWSVWVDACVEGDVGDCKERMVQTAPCVEFESST